MSDSLLTQKLEESRASLNPPNGWTSLEAAVEILAGRITSSSLPYGSDGYSVTYIGSTNNIDTITFTSADTPVKVRTFTYVDAGATDDDKVLSASDSDPV